MENRTANKREHLLQSLLSLKGKTALVLGGAGHLGRPIAESLAELGAQVIIASRTFDKCEKTAKEMAAENSEILPPIPMAVDITDAKSVEILFRQIESLDLPLNILVNCAWSGRKNSFQTISEADWNYDIDVCLNAVFRCIKIAHPHLQKTKGVILNIASMYGHVSPDYRLYLGNGYANPPSYGAAKAGILQLTKYLSSFLAPDGIRVNAISPGPFPYGPTTEDKEFMRRLSEKNPLNRIGQPHELKGAAALLCSDASSYMTGQNICIDGGWGVW